MRVLKPLMVSLSMVAAMTALSAWAAPSLGGTLVTTHWTAAGQANGAMPAAEALAFGPVLMLVLTLAFALLPRLMPAGGRLERSSTVYTAIWLLVIALLAVAHAMIVVNALGRGWPVARIMPGAVGVLLLVLGDLLPKIRYNYVLGVRTPWTLDSEAVWDRTHRAMGPIFMAWGAVVLASAVFLPPDRMGLMQPVMLGGALAVAGSAMGYSYWVSRSAG